MQSAMLQRTGKATLIGLGALLSAANALPAQTCRDGARPSRIVAITGGFAALETAALLVRHDDWWTTPDTTFHLVTGGSPSKGQDLLLHGALAYQASQAGALLFDWACVRRTTAGWLGAALGIALGLPKEIGDGLHAEKGFSIDDFGGSILGATLPALHRSLPASRALALKVFYWPSTEYRDRTGNLPQLENDYAGQRYYLTIQPGAIPGGAGPWPDWLGVAVGHGVPHWVTLPPTHDWYVTLDFRLAGLPIRGRAWRIVAAVLDQVHVPMPGVRVRGGTVGGGVY
jgi:hypothetical protein